MGSNGKRGLRFIVRRGYTWVVIIKRSGEAPIEKPFHDVSYGSKENALQAARDYRNIVAKAYGLAHSYTEKTIPTKKKASEVTGVRGVSHYVCPRKGNYVAHRYTATWAENKTAKSKHFYYRPGVPGKKEEAFKRACEFRKRMEILHYDT